MEKKCRFSYNNIDDSLAISCKEENENVRESFMFGEIVFHLTGRGKIIGLQIKNVSQLLSESGINIELSELSSINLIIIPKDNCLFIGLNLISKQTETKIPLGRIFMPQLAVK
jgi:hypothetical protein